MVLWQVIVLAFVQGLAELLPVSSSAHVVVVEKLMGLDPTSPEMTLLLVMLHTGTMFAVILYFWKQWRQSFFSSAHVFWKIAVRLIVASVITLIIGEGLMKVIEKLFGHGQVIEPEQFFGRLDLIAPALLAAGILILIAGWRSTHGGEGSAFDNDGTPRPCLQQSSIIGAVQGLCLPFRGFSRSGATISTGLLLGIAKPQAEAFSFALAVLLTPPVVAREVLRLIKLRHLEGAALGAAVVPGLIGMVCAFLAGLLALKWLSGWLEGGKWYLFGIYCVAAAVGVGLLHHAGY
ncbi:MAG TPA: undecaprenyl-diphosphate phosphatase [Acidobacteriaceae bacterium]|nr:undecaprenyl-diphosphate phosphatase [Acidobacteriaceae bacterium]